MQKRLKDFVDLTPAEQILVDAWTAGFPCKLGDGQRPTVQSPDRLIRAPLLRFLILGGDEPLNADSTGVELIGAWVEGVINLDRGRDCGATRLSASVIPNGISAVQARFVALSFDGSICGSISAPGIEVEGGIILNNGFEANGIVYLAGARIGGLLTCSGSTLRNPRGYALNIHGAQIKHDILLTDGFRAEGEVSLVSVNLGGQLACRGAVIEAPGRVALNAQRIIVGGDVVLDEGFSALGEVTFSGAKVDGQFSCTGAKLQNAGGTALSVDGASMPGGILLRGGFSADGEVSLIGASVGVQFSCIGGKFSNPEKTALNAQNLRVGGDVLLADGFTANGEVRLSGARVDGQLSCQGGIFRNSSGFALNAQSIQVRDGVLLRKGFEAEGKVSLVAAKIDSQLDCSGAKLGCINGFALNATDLHVTGIFSWLGVQVSNGSVNLATANVGSIADDLASWPDGKDRLILDGFSYRRITGAPVDASMRLKWLGRGAHWKGVFYPDAYTQLASVLRNMGHEAVAAEVSFERDRILGLQVEPNWPWSQQIVHRLFNALSRRVVGFGHRPRRAAYWSTAIVTVATLAYFVFWQSGGLVPASAVILVSDDWALAMELNPGAPAHAWISLGTAKHYETFYSFGYAVDAFVPLVELGQTATWSGTTANWFGWSAVVLTWFLKLSGWLITALGAAAISGIMQRK